MKRKLLKMYSKKYAIICFAILSIGIILGSVYFIMSIKDDTSVSTYLSSYLKNIASGESKKDLFINSLLNNLKVFGIVFILSFVRYGAYPIYFVDLVKGFTTGFTMSAIIKYYVGKSILSMIFPIIGIVLYNITFVFFLSHSINYQKNRKNYEKNKNLCYVLLSICYFAIFCAGSFFDGYISTTFMKMILLKIS